jgi:hypothetical protein
MGARPTRTTWAWVGVGLVAALAVGASFRQTLSRRAAARSPVPTVASRTSQGGSILRVPHLPGSITLDGDTDDPGWTRPPGPARTGAYLLENGTPARPYSDTRLLWGDGHLYLALYAADEDIRTRTDQPDGPLWLDDSFRVVFSRADVEYAIEVSPKGVVTDAIRRSGGAFDYSWSSGVHVSPELDGTINASTDMDEEWVIEMALPFESIGLKGESGESIELSLKRCDTPKKSERVCAGWEGQIVLD